MTDPELQLEPEEINHTGTFEPNTSSRDELPDFNMKYEDLMANALANPVNRFYLALCEYVLDTYRDNTDVSQDFTRILEEVSLTGVYWWDQAMIRTLTSTPNPLAPTGTFCLALPGSEAGNPQDLSNEQNRLSMPSSMNEEGRAHDTGPRHQLSLQSPVRPSGAGALDSSTPSGEDNDDGNIDLHGRKLVKSPEPDIEILLQIQAKRQEQERLKNVSAAQAKPVATSPQQVDLENRQQALKKEQARKRLLDKAQALTNNQIQKRIDAALKQQMKRKNDTKPLVPKKKRKIPHPTTPIDLPGMEDEEPLLDPTDVLEQALETDKLNYQLCKDEADYLNDTGFTTVPRRVDYTNVNQLIAAKTLNLDLTQQDDDEDYVDALTEQSTTKVTRSVRQPTMARTIGPDGKLKQAAQPLHWLLDPHDHLSQIHVPNLKFLNSFKKAQKVSTKRCLNSTEQSYVVSALSRMAVAVEIHLRNSLPILETLQDEALPTEATMHSRKLERKILGRTNHILRLEMQRLSKIYTQLRPAKNRTPHNYWTLHKNKVKHDDNFPLAPDSDEDDDDDEDNFQVDEHLTRAQWHKNHFKATTELVRQSLQFNTAFTKSKQKFDSSFLKTIQNNSHYSNNRNRNSNRTRGNRNSNYRNRNNRNNRNPRNDPPPYYDNRRRQNYNDNNRSRPPASRKQYQPYRNTPYRPQFPKKNKNNDQKNKRHHKN